jgi:hypothetical protein
VRASPALLSLCSVHLTFAPEGSPPVTAELVDGDQSVAFSQPNGGSGAQLTAELRPADGSAVVVLGPMPASRWALDLTSCPTYGPQEATISVNFAAGVSDYAVELLPETASDTAQNITVFRFTPDRPTRTYGYVSTSPFHGGYRWREYRSAPPLADWSPADPETPLRLAAAPSAAGVGA